MSPRASTARQDDSAFERFFREHYPAVVKIACGVVGDPAAAQDVAQDVFIAALARFPDPGASPYAPTWVRVAWERCSAEPSPRYARS